MGSLYFDNAATSFPKPRIVYSAVKEALIKCAGNPGRSAHKEALSSAMAVYEAREAICEYFNARDATKVIFGLNATSILNTAILGINSAG
ncbi:MAG: aminotransferase class V-fold PLP-dependent enzyme, partial [Clostridia bacterium]|nr:aminotransferase class V-fold PLP-dependent enzyme [Clostridia bacterium]